MPIAFIPKNLQLLSWMELDYFFQESLSLARTCNSRSLVEGINWNSNSLANRAKLLLFQFMPSAKLCNKYCVN